MKKQILQLSLVAAFGLPGLAVAQSYPQDVHVLTDPGNDTTQGIASYWLHGRRAGGGTTDWRLATAAVGGGIAPNSFAIYQYPGTGDPNYCCQERLSILPASGQTPAGRVVIDGLGNFGIGTPNPDSRLRIDSPRRNGTDVTTLTLWQGASGRGSLVKLNAGTSADENPYFSIETRTPYGSPAETQERIRIDQNGNLGIGTTTPDARLELKGEAGSILRLTRGNSFGHEEEYLDVVTASNPYSEGSDFSFRTRYWTGAGGYDTRNAFHIRANGFVGIGTSTPTSTLDVNGPISCQTLVLTSDPKTKQDFKPVSFADVLAKVVALPISTWAYTNSPAVRRMGPMAPDFKAAFDLGEDNNHIGAGDLGGVALSAIKGLHELVQEKDARIAALESKMASLENRLTASITVIDRLTAQIPEKPSNLRVSAPLQ